MSIVNNEEKSVGIARGVSRDEHLHKNRKSEDCAERMHTVLYIQGSHSHIRRINKVCGAVKAIFARTAFLSPIPNSMNKG